MKRITKYIWVLITAFSVTGCSNYLDRMPDDMLTLDMVFRDKNRTEEWLAALYSDVPDHVWLTTRVLDIDPLSDDMAPSQRWDQFGWSAIPKQLGNWNAETYYPYWVNLPKQIRSAYIFIQNVKPNDTHGLTAAEVDLMKAEARFLIAYYYWLLLETYGCIPFNPGLVAPDASQEELFLGQTPFDDVVNWISSELVELATILPAHYNEAQKYGRATSVMCLAVNARMLLFAASPLVNGNPDYVAHVNHLGQPLFSQSYDANKWVRATQACKDLIDLAEANGHRLYYEYNPDGSIDPFLSYQNVMFKRYNEGNREILFARPANSDHTSYDWHAIPRGMGGLGGLGVTQSLVDAFFMKNGLPIDDPNSGYVEKGFSTQEEFRNTRWAEVQVPGKVTLEGTYNMYTNREPRFYISVMYNEMWYKIGGRKTRFYFGDVDGGPTHDAPQNGYVVRKKVHPDTDFRNNVTVRRPGILYRLGEAYLNYAEALNESNPGHPDIMKYVNLIRERAGIPQYGAGPDALPVPSGQAAVREAIRRERRVELNNEGIRYNDIRRWKIAEQMLNRTFYGMNFYGTMKDDNENNPNAYFVRTPYQTRIYTKKNYWYPVPLSEIEKNPNLVQNPFWTQ
jgi:hypothetical protein